MATTAPHIPAWKRLGLKLKNAPDSPVTLDSPKRKRVSEAQDSAQVKKPKSNGASSVATPNIPPSLAQVPTQTKTKNKKGEKPTKAASPLSDSTLISDQNPSASIPTLTRRKSVAFTPETKQEDGDSIKQLFNSWLAEQKAKDPSFVFSAAQQPAFDTPEAPKVEESVDPSLSDKEQRIVRTKLKKEKKLKRKEVAESNKPDLDPALAYLDQFCNSRATWKFNKIHQINLIKNFYSERSIPSQRIEQFYAYVKDLKGQARTLLRDSALKVKISDQEAGKAGFSRLDDPEKSYQKYEAAIKSYVASMSENEAHPPKGYEDGVLSGLSDTSLRPRTVRRMRAERILTELAGEEVPKVSIVSDEKQINPKTGKAVRRSKQRTTIEISDSSSSESSDSDSDEGENTGERHNQTVLSNSTKQKYNLKAASSSSDSDSNSSTSSAESSSDSDPDSSSG